MELLTKEVNSCQRQKLLPNLYIEAKKALIKESLHQGMLDDENSSRRSVFKINVEKRGDVIELILSSAGWIPSMPDFAKRGHMQNKSCKH